MARPRSTVFGIGINDVNVPIRSLRKEYLCWVHILNIVNGPRSKKHPGATLDDNWIFFSNFIKWLHKQPNWSDHEIDPGIKVVGNRFYSPSTCMMVHPTIRRHLAPREQRNKRGLPRGVNRRKDLVSGQPVYSVTGRDPEAGKAVYLGTYDTPQDAHLAWQIERIEHLRACLLLADNIHIVDRLRNEMNRIADDANNGRMTDSNYEN